MKRFGYFIASVIAGCLSLAAIAEPLAPKKWVENSFRKLGDEYVYRPGAMSAFTWTGEREDAVAAIGNTQPYVDYEYDDYVEWSISFEMNGHTYWGNAWAPKNSPQVSFDFYCDEWDYETDEYFWDYLTLIGNRKAGSWELEEPIDTFAHQSHVTSIQSSVNQLNNKLDGETKVMRTGQDGERGTGWGYLVHRITEDSRQWRIRAPAWTITGNTMITNNTSCSGTIEVFSQPSIGISFNLNLNCPLSWFDTWNFKRDLTNTSGVYGSDAVQLADYDIGILDRSLGSDLAYLNFHVTHLSSSPMIFSVAPISTGMIPTNRITTINNKTVVKQGYYRAVDLDPIDVSLLYQNYSTYVVSNYYHIVPQAVYVDNDVVVSTNSMKFTVGLICEREDLLSIRHYLDGSSTTNANRTIEGTYHHWDVTASCSSPSTLQDVRCNYYTLDNSINRGLYYDQSLNLTFKVSVSNGCFFAEHYCDGDWRKR